MQDKNPATPFVILGGLGLLAAALLLCSTYLFESEPLAWAAIGAFFTCTVAALMQFMVAKLVVWPGSVSFTAQATTAD